MEATLVLCDHAEAVNGKLYINGGGWNMLFAPDTPVTFSLAVLVEVPWDQTNIRHTLVAELLTADGDVVKIEGNPLHLEAGFEMGRPPGIKAGSYQTRACEQVAVILTSKQAVQTYAGAGDTVVTNPDGTAGVKVVGGDDTCLRELKQGLATLK